MKAVILAGGLGTRLAEETSVRPKPMVEIGGRPIIWHIMKIYAAHGVNEFIICLGYKGYLLKEYFINYFYHISDIRVDIANNTVEALEHAAEPWKVTLVDTGYDTMTGGRLKRVKKYLGDSDFYMTYGDGLADLDITALMRFHKQHGKLATVTSVTPPGRFGAMKVDDGKVSTFQEKPLGDGGKINGGFFVLSPGSLDFIAGDDTVWERDPMHELVRQDQLMAYTHDGFWQPMDTLREKNLLEELWNSGRAPWKIW
jgi:glucose-1-phosphate cytidylyltransferase